MDEFRNGVLKKFSGALADYEVGDKLMTRDIEIYIAIAKRKSRELQ
jgi:hypothetical protein